MARTEKNKDAEGPAGPDPGGKGNSVGEKPLEDRIVCCNLRERLHAMQNAGPKHRTGIEPLDEHLRGGIREGEIMVLGGAPGSGKSTLGLQIARTFASSGITVGWLAVDEAPSGLDTRNLQALLGVTREEAEKPDSALIGRAIAHMSEFDFPLYIYDADATVEDVFKGLAELPGDGPRCIIIDSLQTARTELSADFDNPRQRIDELFNWCKRAARLPNHKCILIFTSELARGAYRSKRSADNSEALASFKESGGIEFGVDVALVLTNVKGEPDLVQADLVKARPGTKGKFNLKLNRDRATFEVAEVMPDDVKASADTAYNLLKHTVMEFVEANPGASTSAVKAGVTGNAQKITDALADLAKESRLEMRKEGAAKCWFPTPPSLPTPSPEQAGLVAQETPSSPSHPYGVEGLGGTGSTPSEASGFDLDDRTNRARRVTERMAELRFCK